MATVVCLKTTKTKRETIDADEFDTLQIVDGQQRLTTLIVLLKEIAATLDPKNPKERKVQEDINGLLVKGDRRMILLQTNHDTSDVFKNYLRDNKLPDIKSITTQADKNLYDAIKECRDFLKDWKKEGSTSILDLLRSIRNRLTFVYYLLANEGAQYTIFEVLNSRGLEVDWLDKCKSMLMAIAFEKRGNAKTGDIKELHTTWTKIYGEMGRKEVPGHEILKFAATLKKEEKPSKPLAAEDARDLFRKYCEDDPKRITEFSQWLLDVARILKKLYTQRRLDAVTQIGHARLLAVSLHLSTKLSDKQREELLNTWERVTFRIFGMCRKDARTKVGDFTRLAWEIGNGHITDPKEIKQKIENLGNEYLIQHAVDTLNHQKDCYNGWEDELRYFLYRYEESLAAEDGRKINEEMWERIWSKSADSTIEHICPQDSSGWGETELRAKLHCLGNLLLLPPDDNTRASNKRFTEKKSIYEKTRLRMTEEVTRLKDWNIRELEKRQKRLINWAKEQWG